MAKVLNESGKAALLTFLGKKLAWEVDGETGKIDPSMKTIVFQSWINHAHTKINSRNPWVVVPDLGSEGKENHFYFSDSMIEVTK